MNFLSQKSFSILFAILLGAAIVFFAWRTVFFTGTGMSFEKNDDTETAADDSWRDALKVIPKDSLTRLLGANAGSAESTFGLATTTTDLLGRELLTSYAVAQKAIGATPMSDEQTQAISSILANKAMIDTTIKQYTEKDLTIVPASASTLIAYQKELSKVFAMFARSNTVNELRVVAEAMDKKDATVLAPLASSVAKLQSFVDSLVAMKTTDKTSFLHLFFINNYSLVLSGITDMQQVVNDPVIGLRGIAKYRKGVNDLGVLIELLQKTK